MVPGFKKTCLVLVALFLGGLIPYLSQADKLSRDKKKLKEASNTIDQAEVRTRAIERKLRKVEEVPLSDSPGLIEENRDEDVN